MGRRRRDEASRPGPRPRALRALLDLAPLADALPAPLVLTDPFGRPVHPNPAFLLAYGPPPSPWTALASGLGRAAAEAAWLAAGAARAPREARIGGDLARVTPLESGRHLLGWAVGLTPIPAVVPFPSPPPAAPSVPLPSDGPATQAAEVQAAESRLALAERRRREAEDRLARAEARADRLAGRLRALEAERAAPASPPEAPVPATGPEPLAALPSQPVPAGFGEPLATPPPEPTRPGAEEAAASPDPDPAPAPSAEPAPSHDQAAAPPPPTAGPRDPAAEAELDALARRLEAPALRRALARWRGGADGRPGPDAEPEVDRLLLAELGAGGELGAVRTLRAAASAPLAAMLPAASDPGWARCARDARPVVQRADLSLGPRRLGVERLFLPVRDGAGRGVLLLEVAASAGPPAAAPDA